MVWITKAQEKAERKALEEANEKKDKEVKEAKKTKEKKDTKSSSRPMTKEEQEAYDKLTEGATQSTLSDFFDTEYIGGRQAAGQER